MAGNTFKIATVVLGALFILALIGYLSSQQALSNAQNYESQLIIENSHLNSTISNYQAQNQQQGASSSSQNDTISALEDIIFMKNTSTVSSQSQILSPSSCSGPSSLPSVKSDVLSNLGYILADSYPGFFVGYYQVSYSAASPIYIQIGANDGNPIINFNTQNTSSAVDLRIPSTGDIPAFFFCNPSSSSVSVSYSITAYS